MRARDVKGVLMKFFTKGKDVFKVADRGVVITMELPKVDDRIRAGNPIQLRIPDGRVLDIKIGGIAHLKPIKSRNADFNCALTFPADTNLENIPEGTEIWLVRHD
jgi:hypothetical protein